MPFSSLGEVDVSRRIRERSSWQGVPEAENAESGNHGSAGICALAPGIHLAQRGEDVVDTSAGLAKLAEGKGEDVEAGPRLAAGPRFKS